MLKNKIYALSLSLALVACDDIVMSQSAEDALGMCRNAALNVIVGTGTVDFPSSFHDPFRDPTVVRLRYFVQNTEAAGTIRCYFAEDTDNRVFTRITVDDADVDEVLLEGLTIEAKRAIR